MEFFYNGKYDVLPQNNAMLGGEDHDAEKDLAEAVATQSTNLLQNASTARQLDQVEGRSVQPYGFSDPPLAGHEIFNGERADISSLESTTQDSDSTTTKNSEYSQGYGYLFLVSLFNSMGVDSLYPVSPIFTYELKCTKPATNICNPHQVS